MAKTGTFAFTDPDELQKKIDDYFDSRWQTRKMRTKGEDGNWVEWEEPFQRPPTMAGLALALDVTRVTLLHYGRGDDERDPSFIPIIARAKSRIAEFAEEALYVREASNGAKFALEVNHRYGREAESGETGESFQITVIPPASDETIKAIPKWSPDNENDD